MPQEKERQLRELEEKFKRNEITASEFEEKRKKLKEPLESVKKYDDKPCECEEANGNSNGRRIRLQYAEKKMATIGIIAFFIIVLAEIVMYYGFFSAIPDSGKYLMYIFYLTISVVFIGSAVWHIKHYRHHFDCTMGMMVGMTTGMMSGFMIGSILGATNGMFIGSVLGMLTGMAIGAWCTRTCGVMSVLEGLMAGLMAGLMGAMTTVMLINNNIEVFMPLLIGSCILITGGMNYMVYKETEEYREKVARLDVYDMINYISAMFIFTIIITLIMVWGPKSALVI